MPPNYKELVFPGTIGMFYALIVWFLLPNVFTFLAFWASSIGVGYVLKGVWDEMGIHWMDSATNKSSPKSNIIHPNRKRHSSQPTSFPEEVFQD